ncbi:TPA: OmpA family protein [Serratia fonticola]|nr:OmpA family protein [Serratia fonticola]
MLIKSKQTRLALVLGGMILLAGCSHSVSNVDSNGTTEKPVFPEASSAVRAEGSFVNLDNLKQVRKGNTKAQLYELIGTPHFSEGVIKVKEWDYIFHFTKADKSILTCQYKVLFDSKMLAQSFYFLPENCLSQLDQPAKSAATHHELSATGLFGFGSAILLPDGVEQIQALSANLKENGLEGKNVVITGHTDRIGNSAKNLQLSQARAETVKDLMIDNGIPEEIIVTRGVGDQEPRVYCPGSKSPAVIACLAPNRRMTVDIVKGQ